MAKDDPDYINVQGITAREFDLFLAWQARSDAVDVLLDLIPEFDPHISRRQSATLVAKMLVLRDANRLFNEKPEGSA